MFKPLFPLLSPVQLHRYGLDPVATDTKTELHVADTKTDTETVKSGMVWLVPHRKAFPPFPRRLTYGPENSVCAMDPFALPWTPPALARKIS